MTVGKPPFLFTELKDSMRPEYLEALEQLLQRFSFMDMFNVRTLKVTSPTPAPIVDRHRTALKSVS